MGNLADYMYAHPFCTTVHCIAPGLAVAVFRPTRPTTPDTIFTPGDMSRQRKLGARLMDGTETGWGRAWRISRL
jgi:hypothetical protein